MRIQVTIEEIVVRGVPVTGGTSTFGELVRAELEARLAHNFGESDAAAPPAPPAGAGQARRDGGTITLDPAGVPVHSLAANVATSVAGVIRHA
jgi:hypothetical protein